MRSLALAGARYSTNEAASARDGSSVVAIARRLFLSDGTVRNHLSSATTAEGNGWL
jgi:two-component system response regulator DesR